MDDGYYRADGEIYTMVIYSVTPTFTDALSGVSRMQGHLPGKSVKGIQDILGKVNGKRDTSNKHPAI